jgi:hypothetical protein
MRFVIVTHGHLAGVFLSCPGEWGNIRYDDDAAAVTAAIRHAAGACPTIERRTFRRRRMGVDNTQAPAH